MHTPVVICGMGRSGTRNVADNIAKHAEVQIYGEIPPQIMDAFLDFYSVLNSSYCRSAFKSGWNNRKDEFFYDCLNNMSKDKIEVKKNNRKFVGYKSPKHERFYEKIEICFSNEVKKPFYIYCVRDALSCWRSYKSMEWNKLDVYSFIDEYIESVGYFFKMQEEVKDRILVPEFIE